jgi:NhaA family Na+:H+ antiporter
MITSINIKNIIKSETFSGMLLMFFFVLAMISSNINIFDDYYNSFVFAPISVKIGGFSFDTILINLVNDGIMSFFFLLIGIEMKYNLVLGEYQDKKTLVLPSAAALGGILVPALFYLVFNFDQPTTKGWAITIASDTAFMLAILSFFKQHVSLKLRAFIIAFSLIDDALALLILAVFYSKAINLTALTISFVFVAVLFLLNYFNVRKTSYYLIIGIALWVSMVESGVHGTLCGVIVALAIPIRIEGKINDNYHHLEESLRSLVYYFILPLFVFINSGIVLKHFSLEGLSSNISVGIIMGLFLGKQFGIYGFARIATKLGYCSFPENTSIRKFYAISALGGIGFTLSFFIGSLAFEVDELDNIIRAAVIIASLLSALWGVILLKMSIKDSSENKFK